MISRSKIVASVIILNWNRKNEVVELIGELGKQSFKDFEIIVVDNNSSDGSPDFIERRFPRFFLLHLKSFFRKTGKGETMRKRDCFHGVVASLPLIFKFLQERQPLSDAILHQVKIDLFSHSNNL